MKASFTQLYIYDIAHERENRIGCFCHSNYGWGVDLSIVNNLKEMLDHNNVLLKFFVWLEIIIKWILW